MRNLPDLDMSQVIDTTDTIKRHITALEALIEMQAKELCSAFKTRREEIQKSLGEATSRTESKERFAPLRITSRVNKGSLEINWSLVTGRTRPDAQGNTKPTYKFLPKGKGFCYHLPVLVSKSRDYEVMLVTEAERKAAELRELWNRTVAVRVALRSVSRESAGSVTTVRPSTPPEAANDEAPLERQAPAAGLSAAEQAVVHGSFPQNDLAPRKLAGYD